MSDEQETNEPDEATEKRDAANAHALKLTAVRPWIPVVIIIAQVILMYAVPEVSDHMMAGVIANVFVPLGAFVLLAFWWLLASRGPWWQRIGGILFYALIGAVVVFTQTNQNSQFILLLLFPALNIVAVLTLAIMSGSTWRAQRNATAVMMIACGVIVGLFQVDSTTGNIEPSISFRLTPMPETQLDAAASEAPTNTGTAITLPDAVSAADWPGFRGPNRDGVVRGVSFDMDWGKNPPVERWRIPIGLGWSSFTVVGDYVFTQEQRGDAEVVVCYALETGEEQWRNQVGSRWSDNMGPGPRATPQYADGKIYTQGPTGIAQCMSAETGETIWTRNISEDSGAKTPSWGFASSPLIADGKFIVYSGADDKKSVIAYNAESGEIEWMAGGGNHGYSSAPNCTH